MTDPRKRQRYDALRDEGRSHGEAMALIEQEFGGQQDDSAPKTSAAKAAVLGASQGLTLGFGDEIAGAMAALGGRGYTKGRDAARAALSAAKRDHPYITGGADFIAGLAIPGAGALKIARGAGQVGRMGRVARAAGAGAATGGVNALGYAEGTPGQQAASVGIGAGFGGLLGGVLGGGKAAGTGVRRAIAPTASERTDLAAMKVGESFADDAVDPADAIRRAREAADMGKPVVMADLGKDNVRGRLGVAARIPGADRTAINEFLTERAKGSADRLSQDVSEAVGVRPEWLTGKVDELVQARRVAAKPLYDAAYAVGEVSDPKVLLRLKEIQATPEGAAAWETAQRLVRMRQGDDALDVLKTLNPRQVALVEEAARRGIPIEKALASVGVRSGQGGGVTVEALDYLKRGLDAIERRGLDAQGKPGTAPVLGREVGKKVDRLLEALDEAVPEYGAARALYRGDSEIIRAAELGADVARREDPNEALKVLSGFKSDAEREVFRQTALDHFRVVLERASRETGQTLPDMGNRLTAGRRGQLLRVLSSDPEAEARLGRALGFEQAMEGTKQASRVGSNTFALLKEDEALGVPGRTGLMAMSSLATGNPGLASRYGVQQLFQDIRDRASSGEKREMFNLLMAGRPGGPSVSDAFDMIRAADRRTSRKNAISDLLTGSLGGLLGSYATGNRP